MSVEPSISRFSTEKAPAEAPIYVLTLDAVAFLIVPPAPSSIKNKSASARAAPMSVAPSRSISATFIEPSGNTGDCEKVTTPDDDIAIASASPVDPIVPSLDTAIVVAVNA